MEFIPRKIKFNDPELDFDSNLIHDAINSIRKTYDNKLEDLIIETLKIKGHEFQNKQQLYEFAKRCNVITFTYKVTKELWYEKEFILSWEELCAYDYTMENKATFHTTIKFSR